MRKLRRRATSTSIPDASLADVAFLLLIFFLATSTVTGQYALSLLLPARSTEPTRMVVEREDVAVIRTDATGRVFFLDDVETPLALLREELKYRQAANERLVISVEPHPQAPYQAMVDILDELKQGGTTRISLKTRGGG